MCWWHLAFYFSYIFVTSYLFDVSNWISYRHPTLNSWPSLVPACASFILSPSQYLMLPCTRLFKTGTILDTFLSLIIQNISHIHLSPYPLPPPLSKSLLSPAGTSAIMVIGFFLASSPIYSMCNCHRDPLKM